MSTLVHLLRESALRHPDREAISHRGEGVTYSRLWDGVKEIASLLADQGLAEGDRVGLVLENGAEFAACHYGVLAAGGVVVAMNAGEKARRIRSTLLHCGARWLFADPSNREIRNSSHCLPDGVRMLEVGNALGRGSGAPEPTMPEDDGRLASIIYTSGTTGDPKGVMLSHRNLRANVRSIVDYLKLTHEDSIVCVLPFHYSYGNSVLHTHLSVGARLVLHDGMSYPSRVLEAMATERVTGFSGVPSTFALLLGRARIEDYDLSSLRYLTQAGGPMPHANAERLARAVPNADVFVMYGQTEATARLSYLPPDRLFDKPGSCGIPIPGVRMEVRDDGGSPVPAGTTGEIWAFGDNVMMGYWDNTRASEGVLRDGWLRTGDLAHVDGDGFFYIDGRSSDMIKSGAHRICPAEIEEVIAEVSGVLEVAVIGVPDDLLGQVVRAVVVREGEAPGKMEILRHCSMNLAAHKIPRRIVFAESLPRTSSGKVRRGLLAGGN